MVFVDYTAPPAVPQSPPIVAELCALFGSLDDSPLLAKLIGPTRRGPKGHAVQALWRAFLAKHHMGLPSTRELIRTLSNNPWIAEACGFEWPNIPHEATFSRFFKQLSDRNILPLVKDVSRALVRRCYNEIPGFGERVALDSSTFKAWSNGGKKPHSDPDAGWSVKKNTHGQDEYVYGWKLHLLVDCESELPVAANVSAGNVHDSKRASNVLREARVAYGPFHPRFVIADKGYAGNKLFKLIRGQYKAQPVIDLRAGMKKLLAREGPQQALPGFQALRAQRQAVERAFSRLKGQRSLNSIRVRRLRKVTLHVYLSLIAMQAQVIT